jgi:hypothetical protein
MRYPTVIKAMEEAKRFVKKCEAYTARVRADTGKNVIKEWAGLGTPEAASVKRASMDVTRAMADIRMDR